MLNRVLQVKHFGGPEGLEVVDAPLPTAARGEVRVRVLASGLEYTDVLIRRHLYPQTMRRRLPFVMGYDLVGLAVGVFHRVDFADPCKALVLNPPSAM